MLFDVAEGRLVTVFPMCPLIVGVCQGVHSLPPEVGEPAEFSNNAK
jgi:hypothetical protein